MEKYKNIFLPKSRAFLVLNNKIEDIVQQSKLIWKIFFGVLLVDEKNDENE